MYECVERESKHSRARSNMSEDSSLSLLFNVASLTSIATVSLGWIGAEKSYVSISIDALADSSHFPLTRGFPFFVAVFC